ncbi:MAG: polyprenyl synthetase family protein, partial [Candidatus Aminicenantes bacterium]
AELRLAQKKEAIDRELEGILSRGDSLLSQAMRYAVLGGGKRFRPLLLLSAGEEFGVRIEDSLPFGCAVELIHNYSLVHDDLPSMDDDEFRRGKPTCHKAFGEGIALLVGDALLTLAFEVMASAPLGINSDAKKERSIAELSRLAGTEGMIGGQLLDITLTPESISEELFHELVQKKTGALITASVRIGAILGGADDSRMEAITRYGENIGLAFQIKDDLLDTMEDTQREDVYRPNSVSLFGLDQTLERLDAFVARGIEALERGAVASPELRFLAEMLLDVKNKIK